MGILWLQWGQQQRIGTGDHGVCESCRKQWPCATLCWHCSSACGRPTKQEQSNGCQAQNWTLYIDVSVYGGWDVWMYGDPAGPWIRLFKMEQCLFVWKMICMKASKSVKMSICETQRSFTSLVFERHIVLVSRREKSRTFSTYTSLFIWFKLSNFFCLASPLHAQMSSIYSLIFKNIKHKP